MMEQAEAISGSRESIEIYVTQTCSCVSRSAGAFIWELLESGWEMLTVKINKPRTAENVKEVCAAVDYARPLGVEIDVVVIGG